MRQNALRIATLACGLFLCGCSGLTEIENSVTHFDQAAHATSTAEQAFLSAVQTADCDSQFYKAAFDFSQKPANNFQLAGYCKPTVITPDQIKVRTALMSALVLYADQMQALASSDDDKKLGTNAQALAGDLTKAAKAESIKLSPTDSQLVAGVETAFVEIGKLVIDGYKNAQLRDTAVAMQPHIDAIAVALQKENYALGQSIVSTNKVLEAQLRAVVAGSPANGRFYSVIFARNTLATATGTPTSAIGLIKDWGSADPAASVNQALTALQSGNQAMATSGSGGIYAAAQDLYTRATDASTTYNALISGKPPTS